jgi:hypothetical protein
VTTEHVSHADILSAVNRLADVVGGERYDPATGLIKPTGLFARLSAIEDKVEADHRKDEIDALKWKSRIWGVTASASIFVAVVTWIAGDRLDNAQEMIRKEPAKEAPKDTKK